VARKDRAEPDTVRAHPPAAIRAHQEGGGIAALARPSLDGAGKLRGRDALCCILLLHCSLAGAFKGAAWCAAIGAVVDAGAAEEVLLEEGTPVAWVGWTVVAWYVPHYFGAGRLSELLCLRAVSAVE